MRSCCKARAGLRRWVVAILSISAWSMRIVRIRAFQKRKDRRGSTVDLAMKLFRGHVVEFELASVILLVALIGAIYLRGGEEMIPAQYLLVLSAIVF